MFKENYYKKNYVSSGFGVERGSYKHEGVDYTGSKNDPILNLFCGDVVAIINNHKFYGNFMTIETNLNNIFFITENLLADYCHMYSCRQDLINSTVDCGILLGGMGNSGNCYTKYDRQKHITDKYRPITKEEQNDITCDLGVHLHLSLYQKAKFGEQTKLLRLLKDEKIVSDNPTSDDYFWQWGNIFYAPRLIFKLFEGSIKWKDL